MEPKTEKESCPCGSDEMRKKGQENGSSTNNTNTFDNKLLDDFAKVITSEGSKFFGDLLSKLGVDDEFAKEATDSIKKTMAEFATGKPAEEGGKEGGTKEESTKAEDLPSCPLFKVFLSVPEKPVISGLGVNYLEREDGSYHVRLSFDVATVDDAHRIVKYLTNK